jgi:hypothetical protein
MTVGDGNGNLALANTPGAVDSTFKTNIGNGLSNSAYGIAILSDGRILAHGVSDQLKRFSETGVADTTFNTEAAKGSVLGNPRGIEIDSLGRIVVGDNSDGLLNRFSSSGAVDTDFNTASKNALGTGSAANTVAIHTNDSVLVGGSFVGGLKKVTSTGTADTTFNNNTNTSVGATVLCVTSARCDKYGESRWLVLCSWGTKTTSAGKSCARTLMASAIDWS